jgi:hypothetical protein
MLRTIAILLAATVSAGAQIGQSFPHTNKYGRATIEYRHEGLGVVANYDYSQKNHSSPWLLIDVALGSADRFVLHRTNFKLVTPDGQTIPLASQQQGRADTENINLLIQNAKIHRHDRVAQGPLLFRSPDGSWKEGTHRLVLTNDKAKAELPITLQ